MIDSMIVE